MNFKRNCLPYAMFILTSISSPWAMADSEFAQDVKWNSEKMQEFVDLPNKGTITTGFYDCMVKHVKDRPYEYCLPAEVKYQDQVVNTLAKEYYLSLKGAQQKAFEKQQKEFLSNRLTQCSWTDDPRLVSNPKTIKPETINQLKCLLDLTLTRRLQLEKLNPMGNE